MISFRMKPENELEKEGRDNIPSPEDEIVCPNCHRTLKKNDILPFMTCSCGHHFRLKARERIGLFFNGFSELFEDEKTRDILSFPGYGDKLEKARKASGENESVITGIASIDGRKVAVFVMESLFMMGSMGHVTGEKITKLFEYALANSLPVIGFTASGGARMQEGLISLMQMAKVSGAVKRHSNAGLLYIAVLTDPTTGGVTASFAMEADIILSEPGALIGFAGKRVIEQTTKKELPKGFQKAEFLLKCGFIDKIVHRKDLEYTLRQLLILHGIEKEEKESIG